MIQQFFSRLKNQKLTNWDFAIIGVAISGLFTLFAFGSYIQNAIMIPMDVYYRYFTGILFQYVIWFIIYKALKKFQVKADNIYLNIASYVVLILPWIYWYFENTLLSLNPIFINNFFPYVSIIGLIAGLVFALRSRAFSSVVALLITLLSVALLADSLGSLFVADDTPRYITSCNGYGYIYSYTRIIGENKGGSKYAYATNIYYIKDNSKMPVLEFQGKTPNYKTETGKPINPELGIDTTSLANCLRNI